MLMSRTSVAALTAATVVLLGLLVPRPANANVFTCKPVQVADFPQSRIHVRCAPGDGSIEYFALGASDANEANRVLSLAAAALAGNRLLVIFYDPNDLSGAGIGCQNHDCRLIQGIEML